MSLQPSHFVTIIKVFPVVRLWFRSCQFSTNEYDNFYGGGCVLCHRLVLLVTALSVVTRLATDGIFSLLSLSQMVCHG